MSDWRPKMSEEDSGRISFSLGQLEEAFQGISGQLDEDEEAQTGPGEESEDFGTEDQADE